MTQALRMTQRPTDGVSDWLPRSLLAAARWIDVEPGAYLFHARDPVRWVYWVERGALKLVRFAPDGTEIVLHRAGAGEVFAEASLSAGRYHCDGLCVRESRLLMLPVVSFRQALRNDPDFAEVWREGLARALRSQRARYERLGLKSARARVLHYLVSEGRGEPPAVVLSGTLREWAEELGLAPETLYRTLADLVQTGIVTRNGPIIQLAAY